MKLDLRLIPCFLALISFSFAQRGERDSNLIGHGSAIQVYRFEYHFEVTEPLLPFSEARKVSVPDSCIVEFEAYGNEGDTKWLRNGLPIASNARYETDGRRLRIKYCTSDDDGIYTVHGRNYVRPIELVVNNDLRDIANASCLVRINSGESATSGFAVSGVESRIVLLRAIGPSLKKFGIGSPANRPRFLLYDCKGTIVGRSEKLNPLNFQSVHALIFKEAGAFPLDDGTSDNLLFMRLKPGVYTATISDDDSGGVVLFEVYMLPYDSFFANLALPR